MAGHGLLATTHHGDANQEKENGNARY